MDSERWEKLPGGLGENSQSEAALKAGITVREESLQELQSR